MAETSRGSSLFSFPNPVNDVAARTVATGVVLMALLVAVLGWGWVLIPLTYGFWARVLTGPTLSPLGRIATLVVAPRLARHEKLVPGPPKRFAQGIGVAFSTTASVLWLAGAPGAARVVVALLAGAAFLEAAFGLCLGCKAFAVLMRMGVVPESVCRECNDLSLRIPGLAARVD
ncbi:MAG: DUF4395 domain-containing protein [Microthrixaceae bacterium]